MTQGPIDEAFVLVSPDLSGFAAKFKAELKAAFATVKDPKVKVQPELQGFSEKVKAKVKETEKTSKTKIPVAPDLSRFSAETRAFLQRFDPKEQIKLAAALDRASFARTVAEAKRIAKGADTTAKFDVDRSQIRTATRDFNLLGSSGRRALRSLNHEVFNSNIRLREMANILGGATLPVLVSLASVGVAAFTSLGAAAVAAAAAIAVLPGLLAAAAQAIGVTALAFGGLGAALKAMGTEQAGAGKTAATGAKQQAAAAETQRRAAESVADAQRALARIQRDGAQTAIDALRSVRSAQEDLTRARREALDNLKDLHLEERGLALTQEEAKLRIIEAQQELNKILADPKATELEKQRASLRLRQAQLDRDETARRIELNKREIKQGVEGAGAVVAARERVTEAQRSAARSAKESAEQVVDAQRAVTRALRDQAATAASAGLAAAAAAPGINKLGQAMANLSPAGQRFARFLFSLRPKFLELRGLAQAGLFPGLEDAIRRLVGAHFPGLRRVVDLTARTLGNLAVEGGKLMSSGPWTRDFEAIGRENVRLIDQFGRVGLNLADALRNIISAAAPLTRMIGDMALAWSENVKGAAAAGRESGKLEKFFRQAGDALQSLLRIAGNIGGTLAAIFTAAFPSGAGLLGTLEQATGRMRDLATSAKGGAALREFFDKARPAIETIARLLVEFAKRMFEIVVHIKNATEAIARFLDKHPELRNMIVSALALVLAFKALNVAGLAGIVGALGQLAVVNPILALVAGAVLALGAAFVFAYNNSQPFREAVNGLAATVRGAVLPALKSFGQFISQDVVPAIQRTIPFVRDQLVVGLQALQRSLKDNQPQLRIIGRLLLEIGKFIGVTVIPVLIRLYAVHLRGLFTALGVAVTAIGLLVRAFRLAVSPILDALALILDAAVTAFGWIPGIGDKLRVAQGKFRAFRESVNASLDGLRDKNIKVKATFGFNTPPGVSMHDIVGARGGFVTPSAIVPRRLHRGGMLHGPGTETSDSIPAWLSRGEYVVRAKAVRALGRNYLDWINAQGFASGGGVSVSASLPSLSSFQKVLVGFEHGIERVINRLAVKFDKLAESSSASEKTSGVSFGGAAMSYIANFIKAAGVPFSVISGFRPGARTRGTGSVSLHALGRALDLVGPDMMAIWAAATKIPFRKEVIYSPAPFQVYGTRKHPGPPSNAKTRADHYNHVHVGLFDRGGFLMPGFNLMENRTGRVEQLAPVQSRRDALGRLSAGGGTTIETLIVQPLAGQFRLRDVMTELRLQGVH